SVIAAASNGGKIIQQAGGFKNQDKKRMLTGHTAFNGLDDDEQALHFEAYMTKLEEYLLTETYEDKLTIFMHGRYVLYIRIQYYPATASSAPFFIVYLTIDTQEAMGANMMNTMLEALKAHILGQVDFIANIDGLMAILSNYAVEATATATCEITAHLLDKGPI